VRLLHAGGEGVAQGLGLLAQGRRLAAHAEARVHAAPRRAQVTRVAGLVEQEEVRLGRVEQV
jgi:hypothetical protein